jgi:tellurite resistance protein TerC
MSHYAPPHPQLFPMDRVWWLYGLFCLMILGSLLLDMRRRGGRESGGQKDALLNVVFWISFALIFCAGLYFYGLWSFPHDPRLAGCDPVQLARQCSLEFLSGWLVEKSLSIDNLFIFLVVFDFFAIPRQYRHKILFYGIVGALIFRAIFIALGSVLMQVPWIPPLFGLFLLFTGLKVAFGPESHPDPAKNVMVKTLRRILPITPSLRDGCFVVREAGVLMGTPLLLALVVIEFTDILFAFDSVPAIFAITTEPFIVFTSNIFAILGLRALFFVLAGMASKFHLLKYGLGFILVFVGSKMLWLDHHFPGGHFPTWLSLLVILGTLLLTGLLSLWIPKREEA